MVIFFGAVARTYPTLTIVEKAAGWIATAIKHEEW